jgi:hypothetical protein
MNKNKSCQSWPKMVAGHHWKKKSSPIKNLTYPTTLSTHMLITVSPHTLAFPAITNSPVGEQTTDLSELNLFDA